MNTYKIPTDISAHEVQRILSKENYQGLAIAVGEDVTQHHELPSDVCSGKAVLFNKAGTIFIFNCAHPLWQDKSYIKQLADDNWLKSCPLSPGVNKVMDDSIESYFDINFIPPVAPEPAPEPEPVVEPEPSDFEVESWVPQDESTEEDDA